jgi:hypothetical protein
MKCPECVKEGKRSNVYEDYTTCTAMGFINYYDEDGKHHSHDPNITTLRFYCSNKHSWSKQSSRSCWCGWGKKDE